MSGLAASMQLELFDSAATAGVLEALRAARPMLDNGQVTGLAPTEQAVLDLACRDGGWRPAEPPSHDPKLPDPWTDLLAAARPTAQRRDLGQFFTPWPIVCTMVEWVREQHPETIVDVGCGTGRFALAAAQAMPAARILAIDSDPVATLLCRAHAKRQGLQNLVVCCQDYLREPLPPHEGRTAFIGNPPYVRHHRIPAQTKAWAAATCAALGLPCSGLAGLHAYFFLATALHACKGDVGCFITSAEWMDVNYGALVRRLLVERMGILSLCMLDPAAAAFDDAMTSAAITCFEAGRPVETLRFSVVPAFTAAAGPTDARVVPRDQLAGTWGGLRTVRHAHPAADSVPLGSIARVRRGIATGANGFFVMTWDEALRGGLMDFAHPVIAAGREILDSGGQIARETRHCLVMLPRDLEALSGDARKAARRFVAEGERHGVHSRYLCTHRSPWWWLGTAQPAPIVVSYMARRPPVFALNPHGVLIVNIAHGLFPRRALPINLLRSLADLLNGSAARFVGGGRCYQGGLEKFEPREMERLLLPRSPATDVLTDFRAAIPVTDDYAIAATA